MTAPWSGTGPEGASEDQLRQGIGEGPDDLRGADQLAEQVHDLRTIQGDSWIRGLLLRVGLLRSVILLYGIAGVDPRGVDQIA